ncbi:MAG: O-antigen ligase family protein [bacterium]|nr:O-antigen ligase family protein [bacterium]
MKDLPRYITLLLLFGLPFVILPFGTSQFEIPKVILAQVMIEALVFFALFFRQRIILTAIEKTCYFILFFIPFLDLFLFTSGVSFFGNPFRQQGAFLFFHLLLFSLFAKRFLFAAIPSWLVFGFLFLQAAGVILFPSNDVGRSYGFLGEPNAFAATSVFVVPLLFLPRVKKELLFFGATLSAIILLASGSRSGLIAVLLEVLFLLFVRRFPKKVGVSFTVCVVLFVVFLVSTLFLSDPHESRVEIWRAAFLSFLSHPLIGGGVGNIELLLHKASLQFASYISVRYVDSSHNIFLDMLVSLGGIGFLAFVILLFFSFRTYLLRKEFVSVAMLLGMVVVLSFNPGSVWELVVFWYLVGSGMGEAGNSDTTPPET